MQARVSSKGQVTLPKALRDDLGLTPGDQVEFKIVTANSVNLRKLNAPSSCAGILEHFAKEKPVTVEEVDAGVAEYHRIGSSAGCAKHFVKPGQIPLSNEQTKTAISGHFRQKYQDLIGIK